MAYVEKVCVCLITVSLFATFIHRPQMTFSLVDQNKAIVDVGLNISRHLNKMKWNTHGDGREEDSYFIT